MAIVLGDNERTVTAYHESGHCLGYIHFQLPFRHLSVYKYKTEHEPSGLMRGLRHRTTPLIQATICLSGPAAESRFTGQPLVDCLKHHGHIDCDMALDALR